MPHLRILARRSIRGRKRRSIRGRKRGTARVRPTKTRPRGVSAGRSRRKLPAGIRKRAGIARGRTIIKPRRLRRR